MIEKYSLYEFEIKRAIVLVDEIAVLKFVYVIYEMDCTPSDNTVIRESGEWFETEQECRFAAIGHINLLENGEG